MYSPNLNQETLIVWTEGENYELALSFQEKAGCEDIWEKICQVQGKDPSVETTQDENESDSENGEVSGVPSPAGTNQLVLPPCELSKLNDINHMFRTWLTTPARREHLAMAIENEGYIKKLLEIFKICEDLENLTDLHTIYQIFRSIFMLNKNALFEILFAEENLKSVVGVLEYDFDSMDSQQIENRKKHREFLWEKAAFKEVIPFSNEELRAKIHQTYRAQYIQEVVFPAPSVFEENLLSTLNSFIFFNKVEIVSSIQDDEPFLRQLFSQLSDESTSPERRQDLILFLKEFCTFSQTLQPQPRESFFRTVSTFGILSAIEACLTAEERVTRNAAVDILSSVIEFNPSMARDYIINQAATQTDDDALLLNILIEQMFCDTDPELGGAVQLLGILRVLIDPENMMGSSQNKTEKTEFLSFFYKRCMASLCARLLANTTENKPGKDDYHTAHMLSLVLEVLTFCAEHHTYHSRVYFLSKDILPRVLVLLQSKHSFLALSALRFFRRIVQLRDDSYNRAIVHKRMFEPIVRCFRRTRHRYNLLNSALLELFEFIRSEGIKVLCLHFTEFYIDEFKDVTYVSTFKSLKDRFDPAGKLSSARASSPVGGFRPPSSNNAGRFRRDARDMDQEEESYFNEDEEEEWDDDGAAGSTTTVSELGIPGATVHLPGATFPLDPTANSSAGPAASTKGFAGMLNPGGAPSPLTPPHSPSEPDRPEAPGRADGRTGLGGAVAPVPPSSMNSLDDDFVTVNRMLEQRKANKENHRINIVLGKQTSPRSSPPPRIASPDTSSGKSSPVLMLTNKVGLVDYDVEDSDEDEDDSASTGSNSSSNQSTPSNTPPSTANSLAAPVPNNTTTTATTTPPPSGPQLPVTAAAEQPPASLVTTSSTTTAVTSSTPVETSSVPAKTSSTPLETSSEPVETSSLPEVTSTEPVATSVVTSASTPSGDAARDTAEGSPPGPSGKEPDDPMPESSEPPEKRSRLSE